MADEKDKTQKHLFGTSGKSDFIVNMTKQGAEKLCGVYAIAALIVMAVIAVIYYFTRNVFTYTDEQGLSHYLNENIIYISSIITMVAGCVGFFIFLIANIKKLVDLKENKGLWALVLVAVSAIISCITAYDVFTAMYGYFDRAEGLLAIIGYCGFFLLGLVITADKWRVKLSDFIVGIGLFESLAGILQSIPATAKAIPNYFYNFIIFPGTDITPGKNQFIINDSVTASQGNSGIYEKGYAASGFLFTPHALSAMLSIAFAIAAIGFIFDESKNRKIFYGISAPVMACAAVLTQTITGVVSISAALLFTAIITIIKAVKDKSAKGAFPKLAWAVISSAVIAGVLLGTSAVKFNDEKIIFTDAQARLSVSTSSILKYQYNLANGQQGDWNYPYMWDDGIFVAQQNPAFGVGPDNGSQINKYGAFLDRCYNEYIDVMQTRGFIGFVCYALFLIVCLVHMFKAVKGFIKGENSWTAPAFSAGALSYMVQAFFNTTILTATPYFWLAMGLAWSFAQGKKAEKNDKSKK